MKYVEQDCVMKFQGKEFEYGGAIVDENHCIAYLAKDGILVDWHGRTLGTYKITHTWRLPWNSYTATHQNQVGY
jgi:hypothetical protein